MVKVPSARVTAPRRVPSTTTLTSASGCRVALSTTCPVMVPVGCCALRGVRDAAALKRAPASRRKRRRTTIISGALYRVGSVMQLSLTADAEGEKS
jgi:hypothetical protein